MATPRGSIRQRSKDSLTIIASTGPDPETGKYRQKWQTVKRRRGESEKQLRDRAERELRRLLTQLEEGQPVETGCLTLNDSANPSRSRDSEYEFCTTRELC